MGGGGGGGMTDGSKKPTSNGVKKLEFQEKMTACTFLPQMSCPSSENKLPEWLTQKFPLQVRRLEYKPMSLSILVNKISRHNPRIRSFK